jgi:hypothetical protein
LTGLLDRFVDLRAGPLSAGKIISRAFDGPVTGQKRQRAKLFTQHSHFGLA